MFDKDLVSLSVTFGVENNVFMTELLNPLCCTKKPAEAWITVRVANYFFSQGKSRHTNPPHQGVKRGDALPPSSFVLVSAMRL